MLRDAPPGGIAPVPGSRASGRAALGLLAVAFAFVAPFATTMLGVQALREIRRSRGQVYGLPLALVDVLLLPVVLADVLIALVCAMFVGSMVRSGWIADESSRNFTMVAAVIVAILADLWLIRWSWRAARS